MTQIILPSSIRTKAVSYTGRAVRCSHHPSMTRRRMIPLAQNQAQRSPSSVRRSSFLTQMPMMASRRKWHYHHGQIRAEYHSITHNYQLRRLLSSSSSSSLTKKMSSKQTPKRGSKVNRSSNNSKQRSSSSSNKSRRSSLAPSSSTSSKIKTSPNTRPLTLSSSSSSASAANSIVDNGEDSTTRQRQRTDRPADDAVSSSTSTAEALIEQWDDGGLHRHDHTATRWGLRETSNSHDGRSARTEPSSSSYPSDPNRAQYQLFKSANNQQIMRTQQQLKRLTEKKQEFTSLIEEYQSIWYPHTSTATNAAVATATATTRSRRSNIREISHSQMKGTSTNSDGDDAIQQAVSSKFMSALNFEHPPVPALSSASTYTALETKIVETEDLFRRICTINHEAFVAASSLSESWDPNNILSPSSNYDNGRRGRNEDDNELSSSLLRKQDNQQEFPREDFVMVSILPFWEKIRRERKEIVRTYRSFESTSKAKSDNSQTTNSSEQDSTWAGGFVKSFLGAIGLSRSSSERPAVDIPITAHSDPDCAPNHYHYTKLMGNIYFRYWPLVKYQHQMQGIQSCKQRNDNSMDGMVEDFADVNDGSAELTKILNQRAKRLQDLVDQCPSNDIWNAKNLRLLLRSYQDIGTIEASKMAERMYNRFPDHPATGNLWYVLLSYIKVISNDEERIWKQRAGKANNNWIATLNSEESTEAMVVAARRVCDILSSAHSKNPRDFQACAYLGFQALASIKPTAMDGYYDRVHNLGILKFGPKTWDALVNEDTSIADLSKHLHPKDHRTLHSLILIYTKDYGYVDRALRLLEISFSHYSVNELEENFRRSTFSYILNKLKKRRHVRLKTEQRDVNARNPELDSALAVVDKMQLQESWFPQSSIFHDLFRLCDGGQDADRVLAALEVCRGISSLTAKNYESSLENDSTVESPSGAQEIMPPLKAVKYALNEWVETAARLQSVNNSERDGIVDPALRAFNIFRSIQAMSLAPLFLPHDRLSNVYHSGCELDVSIYILVLRVCSRAAPYSEHALDVAVRIKDIVEKEGILMEGSICATLLGCVSYCPDVNRRVVLTKEVLTGAIKIRPELKPSVVEHTLKQFSYFKHQHPQLYDEHLRELDFENKYGNKSQSKADDA